MMVKVKRKVKKKSSDSTDINLLISSSSQETLEEFDKSRIIEYLKEELNIDERIGKKVASAVEELITKSEAKVVNSSLLRELIDNVLLELGYERKLRKQQLIGIPREDIEKLIYSKTLENSNIASNNPEAVNFTIAETILKQYALQNVFSKDVAEAHLRGEIHIHDLGFIDRLYCSSHSIYYLAKYGLDGIETLFSSSSPAKHLITLIGHVNTFLSVYQSFFAGALGLGFVNIFLAPYVRGMSREEIKQHLQYLWFSGSQNAYSRGGQSLFLDYGCSLTIPDYFKDTDAIGPGGQVVGRYGEYRKEAQDILEAIIEITAKGDKYGRPFSFPKFMTNITPSTFEDAEQKKLFEQICEVAALNGSPYFVMNREEGASLSQCCRLKFAIDDPTIFKQPEKIRMVGFQNITVNLPQAAYRAKGALEKTIEEVEWAMELAMKAHIQKKRFITEMMKYGSPLWQLSKDSSDGTPYTNIEKATYIIGMLGLNECVYRIIGSELHNNEQAYKIGIKIIAAMFLKAKKLSEETGLKVNLEESPAESAAYRMAKIDMSSFSEAKNYVLGNKETGAVYYTNSVHLRANAPVNIVERIDKQARFHPLLQAGAITHVFLGEQNVSASAIRSLVTNSFFKTQTAQLTISPSICHCLDCHKSWKTK